MAYRWLAPTADHEVDPNVRVLDCAGITQQWSSHARRLPVRIASIRAGRRSDGSIEASGSDHSSMSAQSRSFISFTIA